MQQDARMATQNFLHTDCGSERQGYSCQGLDNLCHHLCMDLQVNVLNGNAFQNPNPFEPSGGTWQCKGASGYQFP